MTSAQAQSNSIGSKLFRWFAVVLILTGVIAGASARAAINNCGGTIVIEAGGAGALGPTRSSMME